MLIFIKISKLHANRLRGQGIRVAVQEESPKDPSIDIHNKSSQILGQAFRIPGNVRFRGEHAGVH